MTKQLPPAPAPSTGDDEEDHNYDGDRAWHDWHFALEWANRGDYRPLAELLRTNLPLNNGDAREFLAKLLMGEVRKPRKIVKRPDHVPFTDANGRTFYIDKRYERIFRAMKQFQETKALLGADKAIKDTAKNFGMKSKTLREHLRRPRSHWGLHPVKTLTMFDAVPAKDK